MFLPRAHYSFRGHIVPSGSPAAEAETTPRLPRNPPRPIEDWGDAGFESITFRESLKSCSSVQPIVEEFEHDIGTIPEDVTGEEASLSPRRGRGGKRDLQAEMEEMQREMAAMRAELQETRTREQKVVTEIKGMAVELEDYRREVTGWVIKSREIGNGEGTSHAPTS